MSTNQEATRFQLVSRSVEITANLATIVLAGLFSVVLVRNYLHTPTLPTSRPTQSMPPNIATGTNLGKRLSGIDWNKNGQTLVLALSTHCHFCTESAPFFKQIRDGAGKRLKLVGVLPESVAESKSYLQREGVRLDDVKQMTLSDVGVAGTPTMLLVNRNGVVTQTWVGKLDAASQAHVMETLTADGTKKNGETL